MIEEDNRKTKNTWKNKKISVLHAKFIHDLACGGMIINLTRGETYSLIRKILSKDIDFKELDNVDINYYDPHTLRDNM